LTAARARAAVFGLAAGRAREDGFGFAAGRARDEGFGAFAGGFFFVFPLTPAISPGPGW
jgi:hypothetical protein